MTIWIVQIAAQLEPSIVQRLGEKLGTSLAPLPIHRPDICDADVQEAADPVAVRRRQKCDRRLVVRRPTPGVDDDPAVGDRHSRRLARSHNLAAKDLVAVGYGKTRLKDAENPSDPINRRVQVDNTEATNTASK